MTEFTLQAAGHPVAVTAIFESTRKYCEKYLCDEEPDFAVAIAPEDIDLEREKSAREDRLEGLPVRNLPDAQLEITAVQRKIAEGLFQYDTLLVHGSVVAVDGVGYLFTAKSGTGKSTHTRLWRAAFGPRAVMINDDKPFLRIADRAVTAWGSPWSGKHRLDTNTSVPLRAICILERGDENRIRRITAREAVPMLFQQSSRPMDPALMPKYMELIDGLTKGTAFYRLACNMDPEAALVAYGAMSTE